MTLPLFIVKRARRRAYVAVQCPRADCRHTFWVHAATWRSSSKHTGRPCPYCFKAGLMPENLRPQWPPPTKGSL